MNEPADYAHTQRGPIGLLLVGLGMTFGALSIGPNGEEPLVAMLLLVLAALFVMLAFMFQSLFVRVSATGIEARFGPVAIFQRCVSFDQVTTVVRTKSALIDGLGLHYFPGRGWTWNIWGRDCVELKLHDGGIWRIGSDEAALLEAALLGRGVAHEVGSST